MGAIAGASAPELANIIGHHAGIDDNTAAKAIAHAVLGGVTAALQGNSAAAGAATGASAGKNSADNNDMGLSAGMMNTGQAASSLGLFMAQNGAAPEEIAQAQSDLAKGLGSGAPQPASELVKQWAILMSTAATMGTGSAAGAGGMLTGGVIGGSANVSTQLTVNGDKPFSYTDALIAIGTGALSQGKGTIVTGGISMGGAYVGSKIKGEEPTNSVIGAGIGSAAGSGAGKVIADKLKPIVSGEAA